jgi:membrane dipeptidase
MHEHAVAQLDYYRRLTDEDARVVLLQTGADLAQILQTWEAGGECLGIFVMMEGADPIREPAELAWWVARGLRGVGLTWQAGSRYAGGNAAPGPITDAGHDLLDAMADYNLPLDLSHLWGEAAYEALDRYPGPIVGTHTNPATFVDTPRLFSDDLIRRITAREGVIGLMPVNPLLDAQWRRDDPRLPLERFAQAIDHVCQVVGDASCVGIGSDLDGGFGREVVPEGLESIADLGKVHALLLARNYREADVTAVLSGNWLRILRTVLDGF